MNGTVISEVMIDKPHSFSTACTVATQIIAQVASFQYGGQSISLAHLAPFVDVSRQAFKTEVIFELEDTLFNMVKDINNPLYGRHIPLSKSSDPVWDFTLPEIIAKYHQATGKEYIPLNPDGTATKEALLEIAKINIRDVFTDEMIDAMVNDRLKKEISKGIQTIQYQIITLNKIGA
jgi:anaerobic ribonucleoside-triphosphate reductase